MKKILALLLFNSFCLALINCAVPDLTFEALKSGGFRAILPDVGHINLFQLTVNINEELYDKKHGVISKETSSPTGDFLILEFPNQLKIGDVINYRVFITVGRLGYTKNNLTWKVRELLDRYSTTGRKCVTSTTTYDNGKTTCVGNVILDDTFGGDSIDLNKWTVEHKIPTYSEPNFEFNSYENRIETRYLRNSTLYLQPIALQNDANVRGTLDLKQGCTSNVLKECFYTYGAAFLLPPVKSAKIKSKISFKYGKVEIRAKLPSGDWIFPVIQLEPKNGNVEGSSILIAYSRGNNHLTGSLGDDIGSRLLLVGPVYDYTEPERSRQLINRRSEVPYNDDFHIYTVEWTPERLTYSFDGEVYGNALTDSDFDVRNTRGNNDEYVVSLGVAVGGLNDFPDGYTSDGRSKPWLDSEKFYIKKFFEARNDWLPTWKGVNSALQIDYVKITGV